MKALCNFTFALCRNSFKCQVGRVIPDMGSYTLIQWENKWVIQTGVLVAVLFWREVGAESSFLRTQVFNNRVRPIWSGSPPGPFQPEPWPKGCCSRLPPDLQAQVPPPQHAAAPCLFPFVEREHCFGDSRRVSVCSSVCAQGISTAQ